MENAHVPLKFGKEACAFPSSPCIDQTLSRFQSCEAAQRCGERLWEVKGWFESLTICPYISQIFQKWSEQNISGSKPFQGSFSICSSFMASKQPAELSYNLRVRLTHTPPHRTPKNRDNWAACCWNGVGTFFPTNQIHPKNVVPPCWDDSLCHLVTSCGEACQWSQT